MNGEELVWTGGQHRFFLGIGELRALQKLTDAGPMWVFGRLTSQQWLVDDVYETIRLGLIGGGMSEADARKMVDRHVAGNAGGFYKHVVLAVNILRLSIIGDEDDVVGETPATEPMTETVAESSSGQPSTAQG
jgi:hypothetical protein